MNSHASNSSSPVPAPAFVKETEALRDLRVMEAVEADPEVSQRELARELGVAVGVINACVRALVRKGLIKVHGDSNRSVTYHLTKSGLLHKSALAFEWTRNTVDFYRQARSQVAAHLVRLAAAGHRKAVIFGAAELAEIAVLVAPRSGITIAAVLSGDSMPLGEVVAGMTVEPLSDEGPCVFDVDLVVLSEPATRAQLESLTVRFPAAERVSLLGLPTEAEEVA